jgi:hypothetical protein
MMDKLYCVECGRELRKSTMPVWVLMTDGFEPCPDHPLARVRVVKSDAPKKFDGMKATSETMKRK